MATTMKMIKMILLTLVFVLSLANFVLANFVCGQINDIQDQSSMWHTVRMAYADDQAKYTTCEVSPEDNRYCCDPQAIEGRTWSIGDTFTLSMSYPEEGYAAGPVTITTTGEGYDVAPVMNFEKVIKIIQPNQTILVQDTNVTKIYASIKSPYSNEVEIRNNNVVGSTCTNCANVQENISLAFGENNLSIRARQSEESEIVSIDKRVILLESFDFEKEFECRRCNENNVRTRQRVNLTLKANLSHNISEAELVEYIPSDWQIIETNAKIINYSSQYRALRWNVSGDAPSKWAVLRAPRVYIFPTRYTFETELAGDLIDTRRVTVYRFFTSFYEDSNNRTEPPLRKKSKITPNRPLVMKTGDQGISKIILYPNKEIRNVEYDAFNLRDRDDPENTVSRISFDTSLREEDIEKIVLEVRIKEGFLEENEFESLGLYYANQNEDLAETNLTLKVENLRRKVYYAEIPTPSGEVALIGKTESMLQRIVEFFT